MGIRTHSMFAHGIFFAESPVNLCLRRIQEIAILKECNSPHIVRYFGSYTKDNDLWIAMCAASETDISCARLMDFQSEQSESHRRVHIEEAGVWICCGLLN